ncbi:hypothetical protein [Primorskyibacter sp. S87]|uniref:hypothetical protein n=1 Tax=Primorskyibacter sp. S87 TaxID=3415126 RepID=UPI003C7DEE27
MSFVRASGFALICCAVALGVDYFQQSKTTEGNLNLSSYMSTVTGRMEGFRSDRKAAELERDREKRWRVGGRGYLPEPPEGWTRRAIADRDYDVADFASIRRGDPSKSAAPLLVGIATKEAAKRAKKYDKQGWVYERDGDTVWIRVGLHQPANMNALTGLVATTLSGFDISEAELAPLGVIGGVSFVERTHDKVSTAALDNWSMVKAARVQDAGIPYRQITGRIGFGQEISLSVFTDASDAVLRQLLVQIDYDGLNALLSAPIATVGNDIKVPLLQQPELAMEMRNLRAEFIELRTLAAQHRLENVDPHALVVNTVARGHGLPDGLVDLTAGEVPTMAMLLEIGYREGLAALMEEDRRKADLGIGGFFAAMVSGADPEALTERPKAKTIAEAPPNEPKKSKGTLQWLWGSSEQASAGGAGGDVRVNKGGGSGASSGFGKGACQQVGAMKRCSVPGG